MNEILPKRIEDVTVSELMEQRWCCYPFETDEYNPFEFVIPESHADYSEDVIQFELAEFKFSNGKVLYGSYNGSQSFTILSFNTSVSLWFGVREPSKVAKVAFVEFLASNNLELPVLAKSKWSQVEKIYNGLQFCNSAGVVCETVI